MSDNDNSVGTGDFREVTPETAPSKRGVRYSSDLKAQVVDFLRSKTVDGKVTKGAYREAEQTYGMPYMTARAAFKKAQG